MSHILVIEDYRDNRDMAELILRDEGYIVTSAGDGLNGVALAIELHPDLILMDLTLPRLNGWEATRRLKAHPATQRIPVVAFTAHVIPEELSRALSAGCVAIISKPFELDIFLRQIAAVLSQQSEQGYQRALGTSCTV